MNETVSVEDALSRARYKVLFPTTGIAIIWVFVGIFILPQPLPIPGWSAFILLFLLLLVSIWLYWGYMQAEWRNWAFENVRNVHELKKMAIIQQVMYPDDHWGTRTQFETARQKAEWAALQYRFDRPDEQTDDPAVPLETHVFYAKAAIFEMAMLALGVAAGLFMLYAGKMGAGLFLTAICGFLCWKSWEKVADSRPQLILNNEGLYTPSTGFLAWKDIANEDVQVVRSGKYAHSYLTFTYPGGYEHMEMSDWNIDYVQLLNLLKVYRFRSAKKTGSALRPA